MSQPPPSNNDTSIGSQFNSSSSNENSKFNFVDMTKDVEFKTRNKGDKSLKVNKQFRYNKRFQNNFFIFKTGQQSNSNIDPYFDVNSNYHQQTGMNLSTLMEDTHNNLPSTSTNPLVPENTNGTNQHRVKGRYAKRTTNSGPGNSYFPPYITNSETFNILNSNAQLMLLMGSSFNTNQIEPYHQINTPDSSLINVPPNHVINQDNYNSHFLPEDEEDYTDIQQDDYSTLACENDFSRKSFGGTVTRSNSFSISPLEMGVTNIVNRAMSAPTIVLEKEDPSPVQFNDETGWLEDHKLIRSSVNKRKRHRKTFLFNSSSSSGSSSESSVQNSNSNSPNTLNNNVCGENLLSVQENEKKNSTSPQYKKKNIQQEQFELEFLESTEESRDELDILLDSIILENNNQFN